VHVFVADGINPPGRLPTTHKIISVATAGDRS
jgi:hypothetical protein